jgi:hypothetical protein
LANAKSGRQKARPRHFGLGLARCFQKLKLMLFFYIYLYCTILGFDKRFFVCENEETGMAFFKNKKQI